MCSFCVFILNNSCLRSREMIITDSKIVSTYGHSKYFYLSMTTNGFIRAKHFNQSELVLSIDNSTTKGKLRSINWLFFFLG